MSGSQKIQMTTQKKRPAESRQAEKEREIERQWYARPAEERTRNHVEDFANDMRRQGLGLKSDSTLNVQAIRALLQAY